MRHRVRAAAYRVGGEWVRRTWAWLGRVAAIGPHDAAGQRFGKFGEGRGDAHQRDEYISKAEVRKTILIYIRSILNLAEICSEN